MTVTVYQLALLQNIAKATGVCHLVGQSDTEIYALKVLRKKGLINVRSLGNRAWDASLTDKGRRALQPSEPTIQPEESYFRVDR